MEELWRKTSELLGQRPVLWVPVLAADLLAFLVSLGSTGLARTVVLHKLAFHSALGGEALRPQLSPAAIQHAKLLAILTSLPFDYLRLLLYSTAFVVTAALAVSFAGRDEKPAAAIPPALGKHAGSIVTLALRALAIYGGTALVTGWIVESLIAHHHKSWLAPSPLGLSWPELGMSVLRVTLLAWLLAPAAVFALVQRSPARARGTALQILAFVLGLVSLFLGSFVAVNIHSVRITSLAARYALELTGSWIVALPFAVCFAAAAVTAMQTRAEPYPVIPETA